MYSTHFLLRFAKMVSVASIGLAAAERVLGFLVLVLLLLHFKDE